MNTTNINVRVSVELKKQAEELFEDLGLSMSSAITLFLKSAVNYDGIPFDIKRTPNLVTRKVLNEYELMEKHPEKYKRYNSFDEVLKEIIDA